jgi:mono/diheme cytochrome c family protein
MSSSKIRSAVIMIAVGIAGLFLLNLIQGNDYANPYRTYNIDASGFKSNGERIYFTATSDSGKPILASMGMMTMRGGTMSCAACHGANGKGGSGRMMMWQFEAPDIRYSTITSVGHGSNESDEKPYTDDLIKRAVTKGLDSEGKALEQPMPVWQMLDEDFADLLAYLKTLG